jgi:hypothetical protein
MGDTALNKLNTQLQPIYSNLTDLHGVQTNALAKQDNMLNIVDTEQKRLKDKKDSIDNAVENQKRVIYFNDNSRKVYSAYLNILITLAIILGAIFIIKILYSRFSTYIPEFVFNFTMVAIISLGLIIIYNLYIGIRSRDNYNFDELKLTAPQFAPSSTSPGGFEFGTLVGCIGSQCCTPATDDTPGTKWNPSIGKCEFSSSLNDPTPSSSACPTVPIKPSYDEEISSIKANQAAETGYSIIK